MENKTKTAVEAVDIFLDAVPKVGHIEALTLACGHVNKIADFDTFVVANAAVIAASRAIRSEANRRADEAHKMAFHAIALPVSRDWTAEEIVAREA